MKRRDFLRSGAFAAGAAGTGGLAFAPSARATAPAPRLEIIKPKRLLPGDHVRVIAPAGVCSPNDVEVARQGLAQFGLRVSAGANFLKRWGYFAGRDEERADDLMAAYLDERVDAIVTLRGGWGSARLIPHLDFAAIRRNAKLLCGFSDITALHLATYAQSGLVTLHGLNGVSSYAETTVETFRSVAVDGEHTLFQNPSGGRSGPGRTLSGGKAQGRLVGGNLTVLASLAGTPYLPDFTDHLLFIEDIDEAVYRIDRMLTLLTLTGALGKVRGVVFGACNNCEADEGGFTLSDVLRQHLDPLGVPVFMDASFGHLREQWALPLGVQAEIDADACTVRLLESAVA